MATATATPQQMTEMMNQQMAFDHGPWGGPFIAYGPAHGSPLRGETRRELDSGRVHPLDGASVAKQRWFCGEGVSPIARCAFGWASNPTACISRCLGAARVLAGAAILRLGAVTGEVVGQQLQDLIADGVARATHPGRGQRQNVQLFRPGKIERDISNAGDAHA